MLIKFYENIKNIVTNGEIIDLKNSMEWLTIAKT